MTDNGISKGIQAAHERVAKTYGLKDIQGNLTENSYDAWNLYWNVERSLKQVIRSISTINTLLDAGCGNGQIAEMFLDLGVKHVTGADFSQEMLDSAEIRMKNSGNTDRFSGILSDLSNLQTIPDSSFDAVLLFGVLEHLDDPERVISNLLDKAKDQGFLILAVPRRWSLAHVSYILFGDSPNRWGEKKKFSDMFRYREKANYYRFYSPQTVNAWLRTMRDNTIVSKIPFGRIHLDGWPGFPLRCIGRRGQFGRSLLSVLEKIASWIRLIPAGELWLIRRD